MFRQLYPVLAEVICTAFFIGLTTAMTIEPENPVIRVGETLRLLCRTQESIKNCFWEMNGKLSMALEGSHIQPYGHWSDGECGVQKNITETDNGQWSCKVFVQGSAEGQLATTNVSVVAIPRMQILSKSKEITSIAGEETNLVCEIADVRPIPTVMWMIGDKKRLENGQHQSNVSHTSNGLYTLRESLSYKFLPEDHGQRLYCIIDASWLTADDTRNTSMRLNVSFPAQPKETIILRGFQVGQPGEIVVHFSANPKPQQVFWELDNGIRIDVAPSSARSLPDTSIENMGLQHVKNNKTAYEVRLMLHNVTEHDFSNTYRLVVQSQLSKKLYEQVYVVNLASSDDVADFQKQNGTSSVVTSVTENVPVHRNGNTISSPSPDTVTIILIVTLYLQWSFMSKARF